VQLALTTGSWTTVSVEGTTARVGPFAAKVVVGSEPVLVAPYSEPFAAGQCRPSAVRLVRWLALRPVNASAAMHATTTGRFALVPVNTATCNYYYYTHTLL
jgi:hypothetical protein